MEKKDKWIKSGRRLKEILKTAKLTHREFAEKAGFSLATIDGICAGSRSMSHDIAEKAIALVPGYRIEWLEAKDDYKTEKDAKKAEVFDTKIDLLDKAIETAKANLEVLKIMLVQTEIFKEVLEELSYEIRDERN